MILGELIEAVELRSGVAYDRDGIALVINDALQDMSRVRDWEWLESTWTGTGDGTSAYVLSPDIIKVRSVTLAGQPIPYVPITLMEQDPGSHGWTLHGDLIVSPAPAVGVAIEARVWVREPFLEDDNSTPLMPEEWHRGLVDYAASIALERANQLPRAALAKARYDAVLKQMISNANRVKGPHRVRVRPGSML